MDIDALAATRGGMERGASAGMRHRLLSLLLISACATSPDADDPTGDGKADGDSNAPTLEFRGDFTQSASAAIHAAGPMRIKYDPARLPQCRDGSYGPHHGPQWSINANVRFDDGFVEVRRVADAGGNYTPSIDLPFTEHLTIWFSVDNLMGCTGFDSNNGANYSFDVEPSVLPALHFAADGSLATEGDVASAMAVVLDYDLARLAECRYYSNGEAGWDIVANWRVDGGAVTTKSVTRKLSNGERIATPLRIGVDAAAHDLELWFENFDLRMCSRWDSNGGQNFHIAL